MVWDFYYDLVDKFVVVRAVLYTLVTESLVK